MMSAIANLAIQRPLQEQSDEAFRVRELSKYLIAYDAPEENFDQIANLATKVLNTPLGGISLVDSNHVWLKARIGVDFSCLEREGAFCSYAVDSNQDFFEVADAQEDQRFAQNFLVTNHGIRYYAAAPIINEGYCLGTLWVMDTKPRSLELNNIILMQGLAYQVRRLLDERYRHELTGLPNLSIFKQNLQAILNKKVNEKLPQNNNNIAAANTDEIVTSTQYALGFLKIHGIHRTNRLFGRTATEMFIKKFSASLKQWLGEEALFAQINFSKFTFGVNVNNKNDLLSKLEELQRFLSKLFPIAQTQIRIVATVGVVFFPDHGANVTALLEQAENAALNVENDNCSSVRVYTLADDEENRILSDLTQELEQHLENFCIVPYFQPQVNFLTGELIGFESLARWRHPELGVIPAYRFISLAEKNGLIVKLDIKIFREVCRAMQSWLAQGLSNVKISTNFSRITLMQPDIMDEIEKILTEYSIPRERIEIEFTESALVEDKTLLNQIADNLHRMGVKVSIDDFGTGMSNLALLQAFKFDRIKIDRQFVQNIATDPYIEGIIHFIKGIAEVFDVDLICEGLDNLEDLEVLKRAGVGNAQGWLFSRALTEDQAIESIIKFNNLNKQQRRSLIADPLRFAVLFNSE
jgi:EAL domain-containing protein (putative c-di-GMP-specific phosphodiesterase class I)/GGDEF domain-containing protein